MKYLFIVLLTLKPWSVETNPKITIDKNGIHHYHGGCYPDGAFLSGEEDDMGERFFWHSKKGSSPSQTIFISTAPANLDQYAKDYPCWNASQFRIAAESWPIAEEEDMVEGRIFKFLQITPNSRIHTAECGPGLCGMPLEKDKP